MAGDDKFKVTPDDHIEPRSEVVAFKWSKAQVGFGEFIFFNDPDTGKLTCGSERMGKEFVKEMLCLMVDKSELIS